MGEVIISRSDGTAREGDSTSIFMDVWGVPPFADVNIPAGYADSPPSVSPVPFPCPEFSPFPFSWIMFVQTGFQDERAYGLFEAGGG